MTELVMGVETEYGFSGRNAAGAEVSRECLAAELMQLAQEELPHLPSAGEAGIFLANGSRLYIDQGDHPELSGPECTDPWEVVRYLAAGDRILQRLARKLETSSPRAAGVSLFKGNVDYSGSGATWGSHESYLCRTDPTTLAPALIPHLVSRVIYTGAGGFNPAAPGLQFTMSPRSHHITHGQSGGSTSGRGIFHTRNEGLAGANSSRVHIICGESLGSQTATLLRVGTTALIVALAEQGRIPTDHVCLRGPVAALHEFALDTSCTHAVAADRGTVTALELQRRYLSLVRANLDRGLPAWAGRLCDDWGRLLDQLATAPESLSATLDWRIKQGLYARHAQRAGLEWSVVSELDGIISNLVGEDFRMDPDADAFDLHEVGSNGDSFWRDLRGAASERGHSEEDLKTFFRLRRELFEIDLRFGLMGDGGIFAALNRRGVLTHRVNGVRGTDDAVSEPPAKSRARRRGMAISELHAAGSEGACNWDRVIDRTGQRYLDLMDPFETDPEWSDLPDRWYGGDRRPDVITLLMGRGL